MQTAQADGTERGVRPRQSCVRSLPKPSRTAPERPSTHVKTLIQPKSEPRKPAHSQQRRIGQSYFNKFLGIHQPDVSNLLNGRVSKFSVSKLIKFAGKLNLGAQVKLTKPRAGTLPAVAASGKAQKRIPALV